MPHMVAYLQAIPQGMDPTIDTLVGLVRDAHAALKEIVQYGECSYCWVTADEALARADAMVQEGG